MLSLSQNVKEGMLMLGCVKEVADFEVTVSLPCGLHGFLSIKNICDSYTKLLSQQLDSVDTEVGQMFSVYWICGVWWLTHISWYVLQYLISMLCLYFTGDLLPATLLLPWHGVQVCGCQVG